MRALCVRSRLAAAPTVGCSRLLLIRNPAAVSLIVSASRFASSGSPNEGSTSNNDPTGNTGTVANPVLSTYVTPPDFEPRMMKHFSDGVDSEFRDEVRTHLSGDPLVIDPSSATAAAAAANPGPPNSSAALPPLLRAIGSKGLVSVAHVHSTPRKYLSFYEIVATRDCGVALSVAHNYSMFAATVSLHGQAHHKAEVLEAVERFAACGCVAISEATAETAPYATVAQFDPTTKKWKLTTPHERATKYPVINGAVAQWALVAAGMDVRGVLYAPQLFLVRLRTPSGDVAPGVSIREVGKATETGSAPSSSASAASGGSFGATAHIRFDSVELDRDALLETRYRVGEDGTVSELPVGSRSDPFATLAANHRLSTCAVALGEVKRQLSLVVRFATGKYVLDPDKERTFPLLALQHVQNDVAAVVSSLFVLNAAYHRISALFCRPHESTPPGLEAAVRLAVLCAHALELASRVSALARNVFGAHSLCSGGVSGGGGGSTGSIGVDGGAQLAALLREGWEGTHLLRGAALEIVTHQLGTKSKFSSFVRGLPEGFLRRWIGAPVFTPRSLEVGRYRVLFSHRETQLRSKVSLLHTRDLQTGPKQAMLSWYGGLSRDVEQLGRAYSESMFLDIMMAEIDECHDPQNRRMLRDIAWHYSVSTIENNIAWFLEEGWVSRRFARVLHTTLPQMSGAVARQALPLVECFSIPAEFLRLSPLADYESHCGLGNISFAEHAARRERRAAKMKAQTHPDDCVPPSRAPAML